MASSIHIISILLPTFIVLYGSAMGISIEYLEHSAASGTQSQRNSLRLSLIWSGWAGRAKCMNRNGFQESKQLRLDPRWPLSPRGSKLVGKAMDSDLCRCTLRETHTFFACLFPSFRSHTGYRFLWSQPHARSWAFIKHPVHSHNGLQSSFRINHLGYELPISPNGL